MKTRILFLRWIRVFAVMMFFILHALILSMVSLWSITIEGGLPRAILNVSALGVKCVLKAEETMQRQQEK